MGDLAVQGQLHLFISAAVLYRKIIDVSRLNLITEYRQHSFGSAYDVSLFCEASVHGVRSGSLKGEASAETPRSVLDVVHSKGKETLQLSNPANGPTFGDVESFLKLRNIKAFYEFRPTEGRFLAMLLRQEKEAPLPDVNSLPIEFSKVDYQSLFADCEVVSEEYGLWCSCAREKVLGHLKQQSTETIESLIDSGGRMACRYCNEVYQYSPKELDALLGDPYKRFLGL